MPLRLDAREPAFARAFEALLAAKREVSQDVDETVRAIIADVSSRGDEAVIDYTRRFDALELSPATLRVSAAEVDEAVARCTPEALEALAFAKNRIEVYHRAQRPNDALSTDAAGVTLGWRWTALESVGLYVPGG
ncbi:MAG TPA: histidinol dehydrogenase, partial [Beijerinckiaceae bacterium]|nr:histidinol dehydrogenase [Beijerinckiaceae bacterium]